MSELIAEARVLVTPDTTGFRALLETQLAAITKTVPPVPVAITPVVAGKGTAGALAGAGSLTAANTELTTAITALTAALIAEEKALLDVAAEEAAGAAASEAAATQARREASARRDAAASAAAHARALSGVTRGAGASALSMVGLRGATLASTGPFLAGAAAAVTFAKSIGIAAGFEAQLNVLAVTAGATAEQMGKISDAAKQLGTDITLPGVSASDAAESMTELAKAGLSVEDSISGARGSLELATAAGIDNAQAVEIAANALNAFGLAGDQAVHVADVLANSANDAQGSIVDVGLALQQSAAVGRQAGLSLEQVTAALTLFARNGLKASDAGTSFRTLLIRLINPTKKAQEIIDDLGLSLRTSTGAINLQVFQQFADATRNFTAAERDRDLAILFGQDAIRGAAILTREGNTALNDQIDSLNKSGSAAKLAGARMQGFSGSIENLKNQLSNLGLQIGDIFKGPLGDFADFLAAGFQNISIGIDFLDKLAGGADKAGDSFVDLAVAAGRANAALARRTSGQISSINTKPSQELLDIVQKTTQALEDSQAPGIAATQMIEGYRDAVASAALESEGLRNRIDETTDRFAKQAATATAVPRGPIPIGPQAKLDRRAALAAAEGNLPLLLEVQQEALARARKALATSHGNVEQRTKLFDAVTQAEANLAATQKRISDESAAKRKQAADAALAKAKQEAAARDQALLQAQEDARTRQQRLVSLAGDTKPLADDIRRQQQLHDLIQRQIDALKASKVAEQTKQAAIRALRIARDASTDEIKRLRAAAAKQRAQQRADALEQIGANLALRTQIAEARDAGTAAIVKRIDAEIANQKKVVARARKAGKGVLEAILALEELRQKKRDLLKQQKQDQRDDFSAFDFLQKTQGFAANLLGNLIPGFATGGLVGNISSGPAAGQAISDIGGFAPGAEPFSNKMNLDRGVRPVQVDTTNALLRQILAAVSGRHTKPPEIARNQRWSHSTWDSL